MPRTVLDVTRLLTRAGHPVATGVDRVELAYARRVLALPAERGGFAAIVGNRAVPLAREPVAAFVAAVEAKWRGSSAGEDAARALALRLGADAPPAAPRSAPRRDEAFRRALSLRAATFPALGREAVEAGDVYVHVSHARLDRPAPFERIKSRGARLVVLIHDLIPIRYPEYGRPGEEARHARRMTTALDCASTLVANSAETARDLSCFADETGRRSPPILTAPLGIDAAFASDVPALAARKPYFLTLGTIEPRKNHLTLLHVWRRLGERLGEETPTLVIVGRRGWENEMVLDLLERSPAIRDHVVEANRLPDAALVAAIRGARALLFPSFAEGFGLPLAEALALGAPVVASDLPAFREMAGARPDYLDPLDGPAWARAVTELSADPSPRREEALARGRGYQAPSWRGHFEIVAEATGLVFDENSLSNRPRPATKEPPMTAPSTVDAPDWSTIPAPEDDGGAAHLPGVTLPSLTLPATDGNEVDLSALAGRTVVFAYPRTGRPGVENPDGWDMIPGARGCTPQACSFRDAHGELRALGVDRVFGLSTQSSAYQREAAERLHLPFPLLSDETLALSTTLDLPLFEAGGETLTKRLTLVIDDGVVTHALYPVFPPDRSAADIAAWLKAEGAGG